jgi:hypothetical protein
MKSTFARGLIQTTPFPNILIDEIMPRLKDTQWRVLCVVVRQTLGWHDKASGRRKERDWLTRSQLKARTGRNSEALALAIDALVKQGYITAHNSAGELLKTPSARRDNRGRIYYGLSDYWWNKVINNRKSEQFPVLAMSIFQTSDRESKHTAGGKANSTKETQTKEIVFSPEVISFIEVFQRKSQEHKIKLNVTLSLGAHDRLLRWLRNTEKEKQTLILQMYFSGKWLSVVRQNYSLQTFANTCNILRIE